MGRGTLALLTVGGLFVVFAAGATAMGSLASNQRAARHDAVSLLNRPRLPAGATSQSVTYAFPDLPGSIDERELKVTVTALPAGRTGVLAESDSV